MEREREERERGTSATASEGGQEEAKEEAGGE